MSTPGCSISTTRFIPPRCRLFDQIDVRMGDFVSRLLNVELPEAKRRQKEMFYKYGTTLRGLMVEHGIRARRISRLCARTSIIRPCPPTRA